MYPVSRFHYKNGMVHTKSFLDLIDLDSFDIFYKKDCDSMLILSTLIQAIIIFFKQLRFEKNEGWGQEISNFMQVLQ